MSKPNQKRVFKTKRVLSGVRSEFHAWNDWDEGDTLVAKYLGSSPNQFNKDKKNYLCEVIAPFFADKAQNKRLKEGTRVTLNSAGQFDKGMDALETGDIFQVVYNGKHEMEGGKFKGKDSHTMEVTEVEEEGDEELEEEEEVEEDEDSEDDDL